MPPMPVVPFTLPPYFDYGATFLWALSGALLGARKGYAIPGILTVAFVSSVGGGVLRDVLMRREPSMFLPGTLEESLALLGCLLFVALVKGLAINQLLGAWITIAVITVLRLLAIRYVIRSEPLPSFREYWEQEDRPSP